MPLSGPILQAGIFKIFNLAEFQDRSECGKNMLGLVQDKWHWKPQPAKVFVQFQQKYILTSTPLNKYIKYIVRLLLLGTGKAQGPLFYFICFMSPFYVSMPQITFLPCTFFSVFTMALL